MISFSLFILALVFYILQFFSKKSKLEIKKFIYFLIKSFILFLTLSWYRILTTYQFINSNPRPSSLLAESPVNPFVLLQALFLPVGTLLKIPSDLQWGWGEYSAYMGFGVTICLGIILISIIRNYKKNSKIISNNKPVVFAVILLGLASMLLALGDFFKLSPYNILREIPGFSQTRVSSRWLVFASFSVLTAIAFWKKNRLAINVFLILAILELFISFGPILRSGAGQVSVPITTRSNSVIVQYEKREMKRGEVEKNLEYSYFYSTQRNIGQLYSDDSIVNTLNGVVGTKRCGQNIEPSCDLILSDNADVYYWSPNRIVLRRTSGNLIDINMNPDPGWRVNNAYPFSSLKGVNPEGKFTIGNANEDYYELEYAPKLSPNWFIWKIFQIF
jgi:hypothetical protein